MYKQETTAVSAKTTVVSAKTTAVSAKTTAISAKTTAVSAKPTFVSAKNKIYRKTICCFKKKKIMQKQCIFWQNHFSIFF